MVFPVLVDTEYISYGEWIVTVLTFTYLWKVCYHGIIKSFWHLFERDGYCLQLFSQFWMFLLTTLDTLAMVYVGRSGNGEAEWYQTALWTCTIFRLFASVPVVALMHGYMGLGISLMAVEAVGFVCGSVFMFLATDPYTNWGPYLGLFAPIAYIVMLFAAAFTASNCCRTCCSFEGYTERSRDYVAAGNTIGAHVRVQKRNAELAAVSQGSTTSSGSSRTRKSRRVSDSDEEFEPTSVSVPINPRPTQGYRHHASNQRYVAQGGYGQ